MLRSKATKRPQTESDVTAIWNYVASRSLRAADALLVEMETKFEFFAQTPHAGRSRSDLADHVWSFPIGRYVIFYVIVPTGVEVVCVLHGRQDITPNDFV